jgi:sterol desaturase/sphingolipid hydroxylase (fatty acid hydroxylase superfamily)
MVVLTFTHVVGLFLGLAIIFEMLFVAWLNNSLHDSFHIKNTFWEKYYFFQKLRKLHINHHIRMNTNFGIFSFVWDRLLNTYNDD